MSHADDTTQIIKTDAYADGLGTNDRKRVVVAIVCVLVIIAVIALATKGHFA